jgi:sugar/nucleoside kinase (ribokinase family)
MSLENNHQVIKPYDVLVVGELNIDLILNKIDQFPVIGKEVLSNIMTFTMGSSSAIFACNLSTLGSRVNFAGRIGLDNFGDFIINALRTRNVQTANVIRDKQEQTGATVVLNFGEDRAMVTYPGAMTRMTVESITDGMMLQCRHLHVSSVFLQTGIKKNITDLFRRAKALGLTTSLDPQWDPQEKWDLDFNTLLSFVDIFIPNEAELQAITKIQELDLAMKALPFANTLVVKCGREGAYLRDSSGLFFQQSFLNTNVVDSIGAGDSFDAGFVHSFLQGKPLKKCLEFAALTGAINTTREGGTTAFENLDTVKTIARSSFNYII